LKLTVLGCYGPYPVAGGACSGYLVQEAGCNILLDCGNGVLSRLQEYMDFLNLDAVLISHLHADHLSDLMIMRYGLELAYKNGLRAQPLPLYAPAEPLTEYGRLPYKNAYLVKEISEDLVLEIGPFQIKVAVGVHAVPSFGFRLETDSAILVYSGDTEFNNRLTGLAKGADLFLCEANYLDEDIAAGLSNHLSAAQAAKIAAEAAVKKLILTHLHPQRNSDLYCLEAEKYFSLTELAREGKTYSVEG
jgi:ribonuclease BN (tRNA processing enzyme)